MYKYTPMANLKSKIPYNKSLTPLKWSKKKVLSNYPSKVLAAMFTGDRSHSVR